MKRTRIINPKRFYRFLTVFIFVTVFFAFLIINAFTQEEALGASDRSTVDTITVKVQRGDSIWSLAEPYAQEMKVDTRYLVRQIYDLNNLDVMTIHPGQTLKIPNI